MKKIFKSMIENLQFFAKKSSNLVRDEYEKLWKK